MKVVETPLEGCYIIEPNLFADERGYFYESFNEQRFNELTHNNIHFVQDNQSYSSYGVIRGLHAQKGASAQSKLVRVVTGAVLDVAVDIRPESKTFGQHIVVELSAENHKQLFIPKGFLHGFAVISETATFCYKCDNYYDKRAEVGVAYNDLTLNINWTIPISEQIISEKDLLLPSFSILASQIK